MYLYLSLVLICFSICLVYHRQIWFGMCVLFYIPAGIYLMILSGLGRISFKVSREYLKRGRFTVWIVRHRKLRSKLYSSINETLESFRNLVNGEKMVVVIQRPGERIPYVLKSERDKEEGQRSRFFFRKLGYEERAAERDKIIGLNKKGQVNSIQSNTVNLGLTLLSFDGWENVADGEGGSVPYDPSRKAEMFNLLSYEVQDELVEFVTRITSKEILVDEDEE